jgi:hypothetical protein
MDDPSTRDPDLLAALRGNLPPGWQCWRCVGGILYARLPRCTPPIVVRAADPDTLAAKMAKAERARQG